MDRFVEKGRIVVFLCFCLMLFSISARAQEVPADYQEVLKSLDRKGDFKAGVLKVNIPRNDLKVTMQGFPTPTPFGFGGWVSLTKGTDGSDVMMGDLVLLQDEVNPVMSALLDNGIEVRPSTTISSGKSLMCTSCMFMGWEKRWILPSA